MSEEEIPVCSTCHMTFGFWLDLVDHRIECNSKHYFHDSKVPKKKSNELKAKEDKKKDSLASESAVFEIVHLDASGNVPLKEKKVTGLLTSIPIHFH